MTSGSLLNLILMAWVHVEDWNLDFQTNRLCSGVQNPDSKIPVHLNVYERHHLLVLNNVVKIFRT